MRKGCACSCCVCGANAGAVTGRETAGAGRRTDGRQTGRQAAQLQYYGSSSSAGNGPTNRLGYRHIGSTSCAERTSAALSSTAGDRLPTWVQLAYTDNLLDMSPGHPLEK